MNTRSQRIPLKNVGALTLHAGRNTASRRVSPVPQLQCQGSACKTFQPRVVQCVPVGSDGAGGLEWKCEADLPSSLGFGEVEVSCEGWENAEDPYILKGSCGLTYNLVRTSNAFESSNAYLPSRIASSKWEWSDLFAILLVLYVLYALCGNFLARLWRQNFPPSQPGPSRRPWSGWGGGPGGWGGGPSGGPPPPPYSKNPEATNAGTGEAWRPGFWSGMAAGAAALQGVNYMRQPGYRAGYQQNVWEDRVVGSSTAFGGGGARRRFDSGNNHGAGFASGSGEMRPSTGFGGTRNR